MITAQARYSSMTTAGGARSCIPRLLVTPQYCSALQLTYEEHSPAVRNGMEIKPELKCRETEREPKADIWGDLLQGYELTLSLLGTLACWAASPRKGINVAPKLASTKSAGRGRTRSVGLPCQRGIPVCNQTVWQGIRVCVNATS